MNHINSIMRVNLDGSQFDSRVMDATQGVVGELLQKNNLEHTLSDNPPTNLREVVAYAKSYFDLAKSMIGSGSEDASSAIFGVMDKFIVPLEEMARKSNQEMPMDDTEGMSLI